MDNRRLAQKKPALDHSLLFKLIRVVNLTARPFTEGIGKKFQLSLGEWRVMVVLASHPNTSATKLSELTGMDKMSVSRALRNLEKHLYLLRSVDSKDQRMQLAKLTTKGQDVYQALSQSAVERESELMQDLSSRDLQFMDAILNRMLARLVKREN